MPFNRLVAVIGFAVVAGAAVAALGQTTTGPRNPPLVIDSLVGRDLFEFYCASCHGRDGRGAGPVASALKTPPPDLTSLARRHGGVFPRERIEAFVATGGDTPMAAHGTSEMPVWGPVFRGLDPSDTRTGIRVANLVDYIGSIQVNAR